MKKQSAGLLLYRRTNGLLEVLLAHPGGPFVARRDEGVWTIPKGEFHDNEEAFAAAQREFSEEMGSPATGEFIPLKPVRYTGGKLVYAWAVQCDFDTSKQTSNMFSVEWPPKSGYQKDFPEIDRAGWFDVATARHKILKSQAPFLDELLTLV